MAEKKKNRQATGEMVKYLVKVHGAPDFVIELSASWRVTFAAVNPQSQHPGRDGHCLRVYEGEKLRAVWGNVMGFYDLSIPLARKVERETGSATWTRDSSGSFSESREAQVESSLMIEEATDPF